MLQEIKKYDIISSNGGSLMKSFIADNIMREIEKRQRFKEKMFKKKIEDFVLNNCAKCKNKETELCHITKDIKNNFSCPFKNIQIILTYQALLIYIPPFNYPS